MSWFCHQTVTFVTPHLYERERWILWAQVMTFQFNSHRLTISRWIMGWTARCGRPPLLLPSCRKLEFRLPALMDSNPAWINGKSGRQSWRYADAFQRSIISEAIYHLLYGVKQAAKRLRSFAYGALQIWLLLLLADRTNGHAYATVLRLSVCPSVRCLWRYVLWLNGAS